MRALLLEVAREHPQAPAHPAPVDFFSAFGESSLDFELGVCSEEMSDVHIRTAPPANAGRHENLRPPETSRVPR